MRKKGLFMALSMIVLLVLAACGSDSENEVNANDANNNELKSLDVEFNPPATADVGEEVLLEASVTYGDEEVDDADEVLFEYWKKGDEDNSEKVEAENNGDGTYTKTVTFDEDAIYEIFAHTTARQMHNMPKKSVEVGDVDADEVDED